MSVLDTRDPEAKRRSIRRMLLLGAVLCVPRLLVACFALPPQLVLGAATLLLVAGLFVLGSALIRRQLLRGRRLLWLGLIAAACVLVAGAVVAALPPGGQQVAYGGGLLAPLPAVLTQWFYLLVGSLSQFGLLLLAGCVFTALARAVTARRGG